MALTIAPADYIPGYTVLAASATAPSAGIFIPLAALPKLKEAAAHGTSGDIRALSHAIDDLLLAKLTAVATEDRPAHFVIAASQPSIGANAIARRTFTKLYDLDIGSAGLAAEA